MQVQVRNLPKSKCRGTKAASANLCRQQPQDSKTWPNSVGGGGGSGLPPAPPCPWCLNSARACKSQVTSRNATVEAIPLFGCPVDQWLANGCLKVCVQAKRSFRCSWIQCRNARTFMLRANPFARPYLLCSMLGHHPNCPGQRKSQG